MSRHLHKRVLYLVLALGLVVGTELRAQDVEFDTSLDQARVYVKKKWYREAIKELRRAISTPEGNSSYDAHILLAQACFRVHDIGCAMTMTEKARGYAETPEQRQAAQGVRDYLHRNFGKVEFQAGPGELSEGYLELEPLDPIIDRDVKLYYKEKVVPLADQRRTLPWIMYLPAIRYRLYGQEFSVAGGSEIVVQAGFNEENSAPKPEKPPPPPDFEGFGIALDVRFGGGVAMSDLGGGQLSFGPVMDVSVRKTIGERFSVGAFAKLNYDMGTERPNGALTYGAIGTVSVPLSAHLALRPALGYGLGEGPAGYFNNCSVVLDEETGADILLCEENTGGQAGAYDAILRTQVHGPLARVEVAYERRSAMTIFSGYLGLQTHFGLSGQIADGTGFYQGYEAADNVGFKVAEGVSVHPLRIELLAGANITF